MNYSKIVPAIKHYDWGETSFIPNLISQPVDGRPWAELWLGTHPNGESVLKEDPSVSLHTFLHANAETFYGKSHIQHYGKELPFLLKVLSIEKPLSLQVHPTPEQAQKGYARELPLHSSLPKDEWNYKDGKQKEEILYALTPVTAMCGFRGMQEIISSCTTLMPHTFPPLFPFLFEKKSQKEETVLCKEFFTTLYTLPSSMLHAMLGECTSSLELSQAASITEDGLFLTPEGIARSCAKEYPNDPGILSPFFLHVLHVHPGQVLYLAPSTLHAYVKGQGIELMTNSDNVLRGGLTHKKVDIPELLSLLTFNTNAIPLCEKVLDDSLRTLIVTPSQDFALRVLSCGTYQIAQRYGIELLFCVSHNADIRMGNHTIALTQGECLVVADSVTSMTISTTGEIFSASVPHNR